MKITVRRVTEKSGKRWCLDYTPTDGKRVRRFFKNEEAAEAAAEEQRALQRRAGEDWMALTTLERADLITGYAQIKSRGLTLAQVLQQWEAGAQASNGNSRPKVSLEAAGQQWIAGLRQQNRRERHIGNCEGWIRRFANGRPTQPVSSVTLADVRGWLDQFPVDRTWNSYRDTARAFFSYCKHHNLIESDPVGGKLLPKKHIDFVSPVIFTPQQVKTALVWIMTHDRDLLTHFALATFAGIRPDECDRMTWDMIDLERGLIRIPAEISKVRRPRGIHLHPTALAWLKVARTNNAPCGWQGSARQARMKPLRVALGFDEWPHDICRHSFGSYFVELTQDLERTALEMGNSAKIILRNYREIVSPDDCTAFWSLTPDVVCQGMSPVNQITAYVNP